MKVILTILLSVLLVVIELVVIALIVAPKAVLRKARELIRGAGTRLATFWHKPGGTLRDRLGSPRASRPS